MGNGAGRKLSVTLVQPDIIWEDPEANYRLVEKMLTRHSVRSDLYILPETFSTGFTLNAADHASDGKGPVISWMKKQAEELGALIAGSIIWRDDRQYFNRLCLVSGSGVEAYYDKRHLFRMGREEIYYSPGRERKIFLCKGFRIMPQLCYDIRFPVFSRNRNDYDILVFAANWPASRQYVWDTLLKARAIENQAFVIGVNRTGTDGEGIRHAGGSAIITPMGIQVAALGEEPGILDYTILKEEIDNFREKFPAWKDADSFNLEL